MIHGNIANSCSAIFTHGHFCYSGKKNYFLRNVNNDNKLTLWKRFKSYLFKIELPKKKPSTEIFSTE